MKSGHFDRYTKTFFQMIILKLEKYKYFDVDFMNIQVQEMSFKIANYFGKKDFKKGDSIALFMENCPEYVCIWLGLSRVKT